MAQGQQEIFEQAKQSLASELDGEILAWDFSTMLSQLRAVIATKNPGASHKGIRFFCRHYLAMHGDSYKNMQRWLSEAATMPSEKIQLVLHTLQSERKGTLIPGPRNTGGTQKDSGSEPRTPRRPKKVRRREDSSTSEPTAPKTAGMIRKLIEHTTTIFYSSMILVVEADVKPDDLYDGDRIQIRIALQEICNAFGIDVVFPEPEAALNQPVTRRDLADLGSITQRKRRKG